MNKVKRIWLQHRYNRLRKKYEFTLHKLEYTSVTAVNYNMINKLYYRLTITSKKIRKIVSDLNDIN